MCFVVMAEWVKFQWPVIIDTATQDTNKKTLSVDVLLVLVTAQSYLVCFTVIIEYV